MDVLLGADTQKGAVYKRNISALSIACRKRTLESTWTFCERIVNHFEMTLLGAA
jgi:hypothetical protein